MNLRDQKFIFLDCQTTGMHPSQGSILELAWSISSAADFGEVSSLLIQPADADKISRKVTEITGIDSSLLVAACQPSDALATFEKTPGLESLTAIAHYAQFERAFLDNLFLFHRGTRAPFDWICSHKIAKRVFPSAPSRNIRGLAGYFGFADGELRRAESHLLVTREIWRRLVGELEGKGIFTFSELQEWLKRKEPSQPKHIDYRIDRLKRLVLPDSPGVYRMLSQAGAVLYVGKATSLKSRVNSYFRGTKGRDPKKLEMLARVFDINITECASALEAALLENDEIKRLCPPYNVSLKANDKKILFCTRDFAAASEEQQGLFLIGPFRETGGIQRLQEALALGRAGSLADCLYGDIAEGAAEAGFQIFLDRHAQKTESLRSLLAWGMKTYRTKKKLAALLAEELEGEVVAEPEESNDVGEEEAEPLNELDVADFLDRILVHAAEDIRRAKQLTRLLNSNISLGNEPEARRIFFRGGALFGDGAAATHENCNKRYPWAKLSLIDYDRMSILRSETARMAYVVEDCSRL